MITVMRRLGPTRLIGVTSTAAAGSRAGRWLGIVLCAASATIGASAPHASAGGDPRAQVAQMALLAQLAPRVCPMFEADAAAVATYLATSGLDDHTLQEDYGAAAARAAKAFLSSVDRDRQAACYQTWERLGEDGLGLLIERVRR